MTGAMHPSGKLPPRSWVGGGFALELGQPAGLAGTSPSARAARTVYLGILSTEPADRALHRALGFRQRCELLLPPAAGDQPEDEAARHAWAQCFAREFLANGEAQVPTARCTEAAALARRMVARLSGLGGEEGE